MNCHISLKKNLRKDYLVVVKESQEPKLLGNTALNLLTVKKRKRTSIKKDKYINYFFAFLKFYPETSDTFNAAFLRAVNRFSLYQQRCCKYVT